jgi:hypothetical protein
MIRPFLLAAVAACCSQAQDPPPPPWKPVLEEIERIAAGEPPVLGIDTQIRAAKLLAARHPAEARRLAADATSRTLTLTDLHTRGVFLLDLAGLLGPIDPAGAVETCTLIPRRVPAAEEDPLSDCYFALMLQRQKDWEEEKALARRALAAGAAGSGLMPVHLEHTLKGHPLEASVEYAALVAAFPESDANAAEVNEFIRLVQLMRGREPELSRQALDMALRSLRRPGFPGPPERRAALLERTALLAGVVTPKPDKPLTWSQLPEFKLPEKKKEPEPEDAKEPSIDGLSADEIVALARRQKPYAHAALLLALIDDKELPAERRAPLAEEALQATAQMPLTDDRMLAQSMLARRLYQYGATSQAAVAAQMLAETFQKMYDCESAGCLSFKGDANPGTLIKDFAEYLCEHGIRPEELGLNNRSLTARVLLLDLEQAVEGKKHKFGIFGAAFY